MTRNRMTFIFILVMLIGIGLTLLIRHQSINPIVTVKQGEASLLSSSIDEEILRLDGSWRYESGIVSNVDRRSYRTIPFTTPYKESTYEIDLSLPEGTYALLIPASLSSSTILIDGSSVDTTRIGNNRFGEQPSLLLLNDETREFRLTIQHTSEAGNSLPIEESILVGPLHQIMTAQNAYTGYEFFMLLISLLIAMFYAIVYLFHRNERLYGYGTAFFLLTSFSIMSRDGVWISDSDKLTLGLALLSIIMLIEFARCLERVSFDRFLAILRYPLYGLTALAIILPSSVYSVFEYFVWIVVLFITFFWVGLNIGWLLEKHKSMNTLELLTFTLAQIIGYIGIMMSTFIVSSNQQLYANTFTIIYFLLMFLLLPIHLSTDKRKKQQVEALASQHEMSFFNAQIKPHFLYNTFGNVIALCYTSPPDAARLLSHLSTYVRFIFENGRTDHDISIRQEVDMIDSYLAIEQTRFRDSFEVVKEIDDTLLECTIPPLLIQPLVENAVRHGLYRHPGQKKLTLSIQERNGMIDIHVQDTGSGFDPSQSDESSGIGIGNIKRRIEHLHGATFDLTSTLKRGTAVHLRLPKQERTNHINAYDFN
ncbi:MULTISPECIES: histidine kinase [unclassified Exiguobacterium]|uniref:sensor histidine kinase n=1 Tax=unclassified Exiguobacterium TaxID=2644629 RepID=UPI001BE90528|nr:MULTISPECIES: histidine kinase [unclassified Exiguobacterium]